MAKLVGYDVSDVEEGGGEQPQPGVYPVRILKVEQREKKKDGTPANDLQVTLSFGGDYTLKSTYIGLTEAADWKLAEFIRACGLPPKGKFDPDKLKGTIIRCKVNPGEYNGEYSADIGRLMKAQDGDEVGEQSSSPAAAEGPDADEPDASVDAAASRYADPAFEPTREDPDDPEIGSYDAWKDDDLTGECDDRGVTIPGGRGNKRDKAIAALRAEDAEIEAADAFASGTDGTGNGEDGPEDYSGWDLEQLTAEWEARTMGELPEIKGRNKDARLLAAMASALTADDAADPFE